MLLAKLVIGILLKKIKHKKPSLEGLKGLKDEDIQIIFKKQEDYLKKTFSLKKSLKELKKPKKNTDIDGKVTCKIINIQKTIYRKPILDDDTEIVLKKIDNDYLDKVDKSKKDDKKDQKKENLDELKAKLVVNEKSLDKIDDIKVKKVKSSLKEKVHKRIFSWQSQLKLLKQDGHKSKTPDKQKSKQKKSNKK